MDKKSCSFMFQLQINLARKNGKDPQHIFLLESGCDADFRYMFKYNWKLVIRNVANQNKKETFFLFFSFPSTKSMILLDMK